MEVSGKRIVKNTMMLYIRQILSIIISLYTVRIVLKVLGTEDYGIYNVVAGIVTTFGFLSGTMATASQRFFSFALGLNDEDTLRRSFSVMLIIFVIIASIIIILAETVGLWFILHVLDIPNERMIAAQWIYQTSIISFALTIVMVPYIAVIMSHEDMSIYAYISIIEAALKLGMVFLLQWIPCDKLVIYGILLLLLNGVISTIYRYYCITNYKECHFHFVWDKFLFQKIIGYSSWNLFGNIAWIGKNQGITFLMNIFYGPIVNAAQGIANQIRSVCVTFSQNFSSALRPPIVKCYASNNYLEMQRLTFQGSKITFFLMLLITLPIYFSIDYILNIWLDNVPQYTSIFTKLLLLEVLVDSISTPMASANQATGKISIYQTIIGIIGLLNIPLAYITLHNGYSPHLVFIIGIILQAFIVLTRVIFLNRIWPNAIRACLMQVILPCTMVGIISSIICKLLPITSKSFSSLCLTMLAHILVVGIMIYVLGLTVQERKLIIGLLKNKKL